MLAEGYADVLVFNSGLWGEVKDRAYLDRLLSAAESNICPPKPDAAGLQRDGLCLWRTTTRRFVCDGSKEAVGRGGGERASASKAGGRDEAARPGWDKYDRACPRRDWVAEDVGDDVVREEVGRRRRRGGGGWEMLDHSTAALGQVHLCGCGVWRALPCLTLMLPCLLCPAACPWPDI